VLSLESPARKIRRRANDLAPGCRTKDLLDQAAIFINISILACASVRYPMLECRRCRL
jgi:hypothetical protein